MSDPAPDPAGFYARTEQYALWALMKGYSPETIERFQRDIHHFAVWCEERGVMRPAEVTRPVVERFQRYLFHRINPRTERPLSLHTQQVYLANLRSFFKWLTRQNHILYNPAADIDMPRVVRKVPRHFLTVDEVERVACLTDINTPLGLRDRAIIETFYTSAMRRKEICNLRVDDLDLERGIVHIREGKGGKPRTVPIGERACKWIGAYIQEARPQLIVPPDELVLFLSPKGRQINKERLTFIMRRYVKKSGVLKKGACHLFRHTCASLMLEGGADIRYIQEMLGHSSLESTQIYTQVTAKKLKEVHNLTHPGAKLDPNDDSDAIGGSGTVWNHD